MPMVGGDDLAGQALQLLQVINARRMQQGQNRIGVGKPGQTYGQLGFTPQMYKATFGDGQFDPNAIAIPETGTTMTDEALQNYIRSLSPAQLLDFGATVANSKTGTPGQTTASGAEAARQTGGRAAQIADNVSKATQADVTQTSINKAKVDLSQSSTAVATSADVAQRVIQGIQSMAKAPTEVQDALGQKLAFGTSATDVGRSEMQNKLAISSLQQAIAAEADPKHPLNKFLGGLGLDIKTVMAGSAMGLSNMFDDYARTIFTERTQNKEADNIILRMYADTAKDMSEKVFGGKLTPQQVLTIMKAKESGQPLPKGLETAGQLYDRAVEVYYTSALQQTLEKGDPFLTGMQAQLAALSKVTDPRQLSAIAGLARTAAGYAATVQQMGYPSSPEQTQVFNQLWEKNMTRAPGVDAKSGWFKNSFNLTGPTFQSVTPGSAGSQPDTSGQQIDLSHLPPQVQAIIQQAQRGAQLTAPGAPPLPAQHWLQGGGTPPNPATPAPAAQLSDEDKKAIADYLKTLGVGNPNGGGGQ